MPAAGARVFALTGVCGVPANAKAVAVNVTVVNTVSAGHLVAYASNIVRPPTATMNFGFGQTRANNAVVAVASDGTAGIAIFNQSAAAVDVIVDVVGYFK